MTTGLPATTAAAVLVSVLLAGCATSVPDDAAVVRLDGHDVQLSLWAEFSESAVRFHGLLENGRTDNILLAYGEWPRPWEFEVRDAAGSLVNVSAHPRFRDHFFEAIGPGGHEAFRFTWSGQTYQENREAVMAAGGEYTFVLRVNVHDQANRDLGTLEAVQAFAWPPSKSL